MNFKRNLLFITTALVGALALSGCDLPGASKFHHFEFIEAVEDSHQTITGEGYTKPGNYSSYEVSDTHGGTVSFGSSYEVFRDRVGNNNLPSEGKQKLIVVPVVFSDYGVEKLGISEAHYIDTINKAFFGSSNNNAYVSVGEYFNKSSYGKLQLDGKVCDKVFTFPHSVQQIKDRKIKRDALATDYYQDVISWYEDNYDDIDEYRVPGLKEGKDVPIYMVYTYPKSENDKTDPENFFWAYTFSETPLSWSSYSFMYVQYGEPDAHTYIHETGHLLGLTDYYPTVAPKSSETVVIEPTSRIDMMDCSIGDETSFSKMFLNWTRPNYVTDNCEITIKSFSEQGDLILLANNWNGTVFDEYYLIEFYTSTYLNTYDVSVGNSSAKLPRLPGVKIYHVDARLGYFIGTKVVGYCEDGEYSPTSYRMGFAHDNNTYDEPDLYQKNYLYNLILNKQKGAQSSCAHDENLFRCGDEIPTLKFNRGGEINFKISITSLEFNKATLKFEKA